MKVKENGIKPSTWKLDVKCSRCEAVLEVSYEDIHINVSRKTTFFSVKRVLKFYVICSECGEKIEIDAEEIPNIIKMEIFDNMDIVEKLLKFYFS